MVSNSGVGRGTVSLGDVHFAVGDDFAAWKIRYIQCI